MNNTRPPRVSSSTITKFLAAGIAFVGVSSHTVFAASGTWTGGGVDSNWGTGANWTGGAGAAPTSPGDAATFNGTGNNVKAAAITLAGSIGTSGANTGVGLLSLTSGQTTAVNITSSAAVTFRMASGAGMSVASGAGPLSFDGGSGSNLLTFAVSGGTQVGNQTSTITNNNASSGNAITFGVNTRFVAGGSGGTRTLAFDGTGDIVVSGQINSGGQSLAVTKSGGGILTLAGANTYAGATTVSAGTLLVNGSSSGAGAVSVTGGTLGGAGNGTTTGVIAGATTLSAGAKLSAGTASGVAGNLTFSNGLNLSASSNDSGAYLFDLGAVAASDKITITTGTLNVGTLDAADFVFNNIGGLTNGTYTLFDANSAITGSIGTSSVNLGGGLTGTLSIDSVNNDVLLTVVPEPSTCLLLGLGAVIALRGARRRQK